MEKIKLRPLRIPDGWTVEFNNFREDDEEEKFFRGEDLLMLKNENLIVDLGWYPDADINGTYRLYITNAKSERPFESPVEVFETKSTSEVIAELERVLDYEYYKCLIK